MLTKGMCADLAGHILYVDGGMLSVL